jgi:hypothetical protein
MDMDILDVHTHVFQWCVHFDLSVAIECSGCLHLGYFIAKEQVMFFHQSVNFLLVYDESRFFQALARILIAITTERPTQRFLNLRDDFTVVNDLPWVLEVGFAGPATSFFI